MNNYHPYMIVNGIEHIDHIPTDLGSAYNEAKRFAEEYNPEEAGVKVFTPDLFRIIDWKNGKYVNLKGHLQYIIPVKEKQYTVYSDDEGHFIEDDDPGELVPIVSVELPF